MNLEKTTLAESFDPGFLQLKHRQVNLLHGVTRVITVW